MIHSSFQLEASYLPKQASCFQTILTPTYLTASAAQFSTGRIAYLFSCTNPHSLRIILHFLPWHHYYSVVLGQVPKRDTAYVIAALWHRGWWDLINGSSSLNGILGFWTVACAIKMAQRLSVWLPDLFPSCFSMRTSYLSIDVERQQSTHSSQSKRRWI